VRVSYSLLLLALRPSGCNIPTGLIGILLDEAEHCQTARYKQSSPRALEERAYFRADLIFTTFAPSPAASSSK
jgi:hypothetical protein